MRYCSKCVMLDTKPKLTFNEENNKKATVLFLGNAHSRLFQFFKEKENTIVTNKKITPDFIIKNHIEFIISYNYKYILKEDIINLFDPNKIINLHISYLPWNKGADSNFWSFIKNSPKGVSIHLIDTGIDTGDILLQETVNFEKEINLRNSYNKLQETIQDLFINNWLKIKQGKIIPQKQEKKGTSYLSKDKQDFIKGIEDKWLDIPIKELQAYIKNKDKTRL